ncbi:hypothetical protein COI75_23450 [Bacillus cereus]|uniref:Uncharacterized protein n=1 Tax=Bacillus cereus TaxID=1396 RepID=A0A2A9U375_BACCE|nr:hypothetical protein COI75_23450 [Bacillus cereus]PFN25392.1 hypothetical protein COJ50_13245 [Bacillus cereus]
MLSHIVYHSICRSRTNANKIVIWVHLNTKRAPLISLLIPNHNESDELTLYRKAIIIVCKSMKLVNGFRKNRYLREKELFQML